MFGALTRPTGRRFISQTATCLAKAKKPRPPPPPPPPAAPPAAPAPSPSSSTPVQLASLDFSPPDPSDESSQRTGARSSKDSLSSAELERRSMGRLMTALFVLAVGLNVAYMGREWDENELKERKLTPENAPNTRLGRTLKRYSEAFSYFSDPAWPELLPPPYPPPHQKPFTLLLSVDDLLVTSTWDRQHGWRTAKRPGVDYFLAYISQFYEVVIFTTQNGYTAAPVLDKLDRYNFYIAHRLYREATRSVKGKIVKDLSYLNRDLAKVILIDTHPEHVSANPENAIVIPKWNGDPKDTGLIALIPFLESIAIYNPPDVRPILEAYQGKDIPLEYGKKEAEGKRKHIEEWEAKGKHSASGLGSMFGLAGGRTGSSIPPTYLEQKRKEAQMNYQEEQAYLAKHKDYLEGLLEQEQKMMAAQVPNNLWEALDQFAGKPPPPPPEGQRLALPPPPPPK